MSAPTSVPAIKDFLTAVAPFDNLSKELLDEAATSVAVFFCDSTDHPQLDFTSPYLYLVRTGEYEVRGPEAKLLDRLAEGDCFGLPSLYDQTPTGNSLAVLVPGLIYRFDQAVFQKLRQSDKSFDLFFTKAYAKRLAQSDDQYSGNMMQTVREIIARRPHGIEKTATVVEAASLMSERRVSSLLVHQQDKLVGIITDRDLRNRLVAKAMSYETQVAEIMTANPISVREDQSLTTALAMMLDNQIHHLPVLYKDGSIAGLITTNDVVQTQISHPIFLLSRLRKANRIDQLVYYSKDLGNLLLQLIKAGTPVYEMGKLFTQITDVLTQRLIELAIKNVGEPPCEFVWIAFGSQARREQAANSDQDNGIIYDCKAQADEQKIQHYFLDLAKVVNDGLDKCGFVLCPGDVMAMNPKWNATLKQWKGYFTNWIKVPEPKALMHASIFFDMRAVYGKESLVEELQSEVLNLAADQSIFQALLTQNALDNHIPLGFFKQFLLEKSGEHKDTFDMKKSGLMPIVDIARTHCLANQIQEVNTIDRLNALAQKKVLQNETARSLIDAYEFISRLRFEHQILCMKNGQRANNLLNPKELSGLEQKQLKDAFSVIDSSQQGIKQRYMRGLM